MPIKVKCNSCGTTLSAPDNAAGKRAKCPKCESPIEIPHPAAENDALDALSSPFDGLSEEEMTSGEVQQDERKPCPACGEMIVRQAVKCRFCGEIFDPDLKKQEQKKRTKKRKQHSDEDESLSALEWVICILCSNIACIVGIVYMIQGKPKGQKMILICLAVNAIFFVLGFLAELANQAN